MLRVLFHCDAPSSVGRTARSLALAHALAVRHGACCAALAACPAAWSAWTAAELALLPAVSGGPAARLAAAAAWRPDVVVVDLPQLDADEVFRLAALPWPVVLFDDDGQVPAATRFLVNSHPFARDFAYRERAPGTRLLRGLRYLALPPRVVGRRPRRRPIAAIGQRMLVTLDGGATLAVQRALTVLPAGVDLDLVLAPHAGPVVLPPGRAVLLHDAPDDLAPLLLAADLCMASDESTLYEAVYLGTPTLALPRSAREMRIAAALAARGAVLNLGLDARSWTTTLGPVVRALLADAGRRRALSLAGRRLIDGRGAARLADALVAELVA